ncbi:two-component sensor histidine kinase [Gammaproteobacteria bacterium 45_16_T64]|nr:two-component sensor histidine kinase [Gammaproteobacteria bacterium 45_16_T64]
MNKRLLWQLCLTIAAGTVLLFWAVDILTTRTEQHMSYISEEHQQELLEFGQKAEEIFSTKGEGALEEWLVELQEKENTWAAVVTSELTALAKGDLSTQFQEGFALGRNVEWKIHLYFEHNPIMGIPFSQRYEEQDFSISTSTHFLIQLPQRMRPGSYLEYTHVLLQIALPLILLIVVSVVLYRHVMSPLKRLERATRLFSEGQYDVRVKALLGNRNDELTALAETFDRMAARTGNLIIDQRQLIADLSHELRTPIARLDMAVDCVERGIKPEESLDRLKYESATMKQLVEDALTLAWLTNEEPTLNQEEVDLAELLEVIADDARFEYPNKHVLLDRISSAMLPRSSHRALGQVFENIIRNALKHSPVAGEVNISVRQKGVGFEVRISDNGPGVPEKYINDIFKPFFRVDRSRDVNESPGGYGLGLALAQRQLTAVGGSVRAENRKQRGSSVCSGLVMIVDLSEPPKG